jgi:hypothetical protein
VVSVTDPYGRILRFLDRYNVINTLLSDTKIQFDAEVLRRLS